MIAEYDVSDHLENQYIYVNGQLAVQLKNNPITDTKDTLYVHHDYLGNQRLMTNRTGHYAEKLWYDAFGNTRMIVGAYNGNPNQFIGAQYDDAGWEQQYYLRNRYYNPAIGRFTTPDPIVSDYNAYSYCRNNPVMLSDPWGLDGDHAGGHYDWNWANGKFGNSNNSNVNFPNPTYRQMTEQSLPSPFYDGSGLPAGGGFDRGLSYQNSDFDLSRIHYNGPTPTSNTTYGAGDQVNMLHTRDTWAEKKAAVDAATAVLRLAQGQAAIGKYQPKGQCNFWVQALFAEAGFPLSGNNQAWNFDDYPELEITENPVPGDVVQLLTSNGCPTNHVAIYSGDGNMITPLDSRQIIGPIQITVFMKGKGSTVYLHYVGIRKRT